MSRDITLGEKTPEQPEDLDKVWKDRVRWMLNLLAFHPNPAPETQQGKKNKLLTFSMKKTGCWLK